MGNKVDTAFSLYGLVMAGGSGTRFWPESTAKRPKQYLKLAEGKTLLEETLQRFEGLVESDRRFIVTLADQEALAHQYSHNLLAPNGLILEPEARNTSACILLSLATLLKRGAKPDDVLIIVPADHVILNKNGWQKTLGEAAQLAKSHQKIVTIGIPPHFPHTGFGYIQKGDNWDQQNDVFSVKTFKEKPDLVTAKSYVSSGQYYWNAGMFVAPLGLLLEEFATHAPAFSQQFSHLLENLNDQKELKKTYQTLPSVSFDYAIMEKSQKVMVKAAQFDWNDLGSWDALESVCKKVQDNVLLPSSAQSYFDHASGNIISAQEGQFVSLINVQDLVIVSNAKALMVVPKKDAQKIKEIVEYLKKNGDSHYL